MIKEDYNWLLPYSKYFSNKSVLELGAGFGDDSVIIDKLCKSHLIIEKDSYAVRIIEQRVPNATVLWGDFRDVLPQFDRDIDTIVVSLVLHYFSEEDTLKILSNLARIASKNTTLIVRVNSINDVNYGSVGFPEIENEYFNVNGIPKRFFSRESIERYFNSDWEIIGLKEKSIDRYEVEKVIWEFVAKKKSE